jgi:hypothetical protein
MSFWEGIDMGCGKSIMGCQNPTSPDWKKIDEREQIRKQELQLQLNETRRKEIQNEQAKVRKKYIIYGLIAVAGYFAYKKFKK